MTKNTFEFDFSDLSLSVPDIERVMGYKEGQCEEVISELVSSSLIELEEVCRIKAEYRIIPDVRFIDTDKTIQANNIVFDVKKIVYGQLKKSDSLAVFLCTAGEEPGLRSRKAMKEGDLLKGYIYDVIGSEIVEGAADLMQNTLKNTIELSGRKITNRYSPGYCDWSVAEQHKLFQLIPDNYCGIRLTDSALMDPVKSVSGFIGIGENVRFNKYTCNLCDSKNCLYRNKK
jgi:hypothetical protein